MSGKAILLAGCDERLAQSKIYRLLYRYKYDYNGKFIKNANVAELVDALDLGSSRLSCESSSLSIRTT